MISSIDNVLVRAAASSIASGRPSSERHRSSTRVVRPVGGVCALRGGSPAEQLDGVGERKGRELEDRLHRRCRGEPGWCTGSVARARRRADERRAPRPRRGRARSCRGSPSAAAPLSRSNSAASPPTLHRGDQRVDDLVGRGRRFEPGQPDAAGPARRPDTVTDGRPRSRPRSCRRRPARRSRRAGVWRAGRQGGQLGLATDQLGRHRRQVPGGRVGAEPGVREEGTPSDGSWVRICCSSCCSCGPGSRPSSSAS